MRLDIRDLKPAKVLAIAISAERQDHQNVAKLRGMTQPNWRQLVDLIREHGINSDPTLVAQLVGLITGRDDAQISAAVSNMNRVIGSLHDPSSQLLTALKEGLTSGKLCVIDISQMRGQQGLQLAGVILNHIFEHNQEEWTKSEPRTIPTIAVVEEAQSVLGGNRVTEDSPFVSWVKEGRKYDLGAVLVTQQPGSLPQELVSQGDNFFVFHLLSAGDLVALKRANAHFSDDLLSSLLNEPIVGHGIFWSSAPGTDRAAKPYPLPIRVLDFSSRQQPADPRYDRPALNNYAAQLKGTFQKALQDALRTTSTAATTALVPDENQPAEEIDAQTLYRRAAIRGLGADRRLAAALGKGEPVPWGTFQSWLSSHAPKPPAVEDQFAWAFTVVLEAFDELLAPKGWRKDKHADQSGSVKVFFVRDRIK